MKLLRAFIPASVILLFAVPALLSAADHEEQRVALVQLLESEFKTMAGFGVGGAMDPEVRRAMLETQRHKFVPQRARDRAYLNRPLPIGYGQTISQPFIVALMTDMLDVEPDHVVLEVGTGSGYQAAVLSHLVKHVHTIEIIPELAKQARERLDTLGYDNVTVVHGDGYYGLPEHAPYDAIIVTAAAGHVPPPLVKQLARGGRMVIPVGPPFMTQELMFVNKDEKGQVSTRAVLPVAFVPLTGEH